MGIVVLVLVAFGYVTAAGAPPPLATYVGFTTDFDQFLTTLTAAKLGFPSHLARLFIHQFLPFA
jgi:hypothetical protein